MVQAEAQRPSIITVWPEERSSLYLSRYCPICPPLSFTIRTVAWPAPTPASKNAAVSSADRIRISCLLKLKCDADVVVERHEVAAAVSGKAGGFLTRDGIA